ncbi:MAG: MGMT family protein [Patescibacteria group bacterium]
MHRAILLLKKIPKGRVVTYKEMARVCGTSPRAIGRIMASNPDPKHYPCYKVVAADGTLCGYSGKGGLRMKQKLLKKEGVHFEKRKVAQECFFQFPANI